MSRRARLNAVAASRRSRRYAPIFAALGDDTRLRLVARLCEQSPSSISELADGHRITRQAITKHLEVLEKAGVVRGEMAGRVKLFELNPEPLKVAKDYLASVGAQWEQALQRLQAHLDRTT